MSASRFYDTLRRLSARAASSVVARGRIASPALNAVLLRRLSALPGETDALLADPVFEAARAWEQADCSLGDLAGELLHPDLVAALDEAAAERMPRELHPWSHQLAAWQAAREGLSCLVSSGTGSGKTECFMIPVLNDLLRDPAGGLLSGVRAIVIYPLNALIESQRERLSAWTVPLKSRIKFALYNGLTPETPWKQDSARLAAAEIGNRRAIREAPPAILVTNVTMLEYLLLRAQDRPILERSQGLLRWIVLDEAHGYIGAQAAEMALLLRRVRAAFGVAPEQVRLMATSATIGDGERTDEKLKRFTADLAGIDEDRVRVIQGRMVESDLPPPVADTPLDTATLAELPPEMLWGRLAPHPRIQKLKRRISGRGATLSKAANTLLGATNGTGDDVRRRDAQAVLDAAARAQCPETGERLLPWRAHAFHRAQGGIWVCVDPSCKQRDPELSTDDSGWGFGAVWLKQRDRCDCGAPVFELYACNECGTPHLVAGIEFGAMARLVPLRALQTDDFAVDAEPDADGDDREPVARGTGVLSPGRGRKSDRFLKFDDGTVFDNEPPSDAQWARIVLDEDKAERACCSGSATARLAPQRYGPPFFMGVAMPALIEALARPFDAPGRPLGGRRGLTFSDSRQGTARLAAKLQQDAERNLTRAFLYHSVQEDSGPKGDERAKLERKLESYRKANDPEFAENIQAIEDRLHGEAKPVLWGDLVERFAKQRDLREFATEVWRERAGGGRDMAEDPVKLAEMFLYRELFRRPKVQNNAETMGLMRLSFPKLEKKAEMEAPRVLTEAGVDELGRTALALAAIDFVFRDRLATRLASDRMMRFVSPRSGRRINSVCRPGLELSDRPENSRPWPGPVPQAGRPSRLHRLVYALIRGDYENRTDRDRAAEVISDLWSLIVSTAAKDIGGGAYQLDFENAAVTRLDEGWLCPVTRRVFGYSPAGRSPYDPDRDLKAIDLPRLPTANPGGLDPDARVEMTRWCENDSRIGELRREGLWTNLHDRAAVYAPFLRAQEHSAQIERPILAGYEQLFKDGRINLLNCSTTMEMGVDIPDVQLIANANAPPSISNYRQRVGRAGRRGEPWAFGMTFCRDLPLDQIIFEKPERFLMAPVTAPAVRLDSPGLVGRHVHAAMLGAFLRELSEGFNLRSSTGAFFGVTDDADAAIEESAVADDFLEALRGPWSQTDRLASDLENLTRGTALEGNDAAYLGGMTAESFEKLSRRWRQEYTELLNRRDAASEQEVKQAFAMRARRMNGEFLLAELARRGFTPSYGFPVDVVTFDHLSGRDREAVSETIAFGERRGGASRTLDIAIREYAPGAEIVVDGLVHRSEGVLPAWGAMADASKLEDLQFYWECTACRSFGLARTVPKVCPACQTPRPDWKRSLRPAGFLGRRAPHTGYENLGHAPYEIPRLSASGGTWRSLPDPGAGRWRTDPQGQIVTLGSGPHGMGYALCLDCGRTEAETEDTASSAPLPEAIKKHAPLATARGLVLKGGYCPGGHIKRERVQRNVRFVHAAQTDVFELQLPSDADRAGGLALAAGLREALAERLGAEAREIGVSANRSKGQQDENRISAFLYDRASGGAGLSSRLVEAEWFDHCVTRAFCRLSCPEECAHGCPACVLRPDLNFGEERLDRPGGRKLAKSISERFRLPDPMRVFGPETKPLGTTLGEWLDRRSRTMGLVSVTLYLHGAPEEWEIVDWPVGGLLGRLKDAGVRVDVVLDARSLTDKGMNLAQKLDLHRLSSNASLALASDLPFANGAPVLSSTEDREGSNAIAAPVANEAIPGPNWGLGELAPLVHGQARNLPETKAFASEQLVTLSSGNAKIIRVGAQLNGRAKEFGRAFWKLLEAESPLTVASIRTHGVRDAIYTDRYLLTPLTLRLLWEVIRRMPGSRDLRLTVSTARVSSSERNRWAIFDTFSKDGMRSKILQELFPDARIDVRHRTGLPHERSLQLRLEDGRSITMLLDQGFGAWRARGTPRHDFAADPVRQARALKTLDFGVAVETGREAPLVLETEEA